MLTCNPCADAEAYFNREQDIADGQEWAERMALDRVTQALQGIKPEQWGQPILPTGTGVRYSPEEALFEAVSDAATPKLQTEDNLAVAQAYYRLMTSDAAAELHQALAHYHASVHPKLGHFSLLGE